MLDGVVDRSGRPARSGPQLWPIAYVLLSGWLLCSLVGVVDGGALAARPDDVPSAGAASVVSVVPARLLDTRAGQPTVDDVGSGGGRFGAGERRRVQVSGRAGVPVGAAGVVGTVTVVEAAERGFVSVFGCGERPVVSNVSYSAGSSVAGSVVVRLDGEGGICVSSRSAAHVIVDVSGWIPAGGDVVPLSPARLADTRAGGATVDSVGSGSGRVPAGGVVEVPVAGRAGVDEAFGAAVLSVTVTDPDAAGHVTVFACDRSRPHVSSVNYTAGATVSNLAWSNLSADGSVCVYSLAPTHVVVDVMAALRAGASLEPISSARLADSRRGEPTIDAKRRGFGPIGADRIVAVDVAGRGGVSRRASAVAVTVTVVDPAANGHVTVYACGQPRPLASNLNYRAGETVAASVWSELSDAGRVCVYTYAAADVVVDVNVVQVPWSVALAAGSSHSCHVMGGVVECWGKNHLGQLGDGSTDDRRTPVVVEGLATVVSVAVGGGHTCAVLDAGGVRCWGYNALGQVGDGTTNMRRAPVAVDGVVDVVGVAAGDYHTCAVTATGEVWCWGDDVFGQLGDGPGSGTGAVQVEGIEGAATISAAGDSTCALTAVGDVWCWGYNGDGQLGDGTEVDRAAPVRVDGISGVAGVSVGFSHTCVWSIDGSAWCWGGNDVGQLGDGTTTARPSPTTLVGPDEPLAVVATGSGRHSCAVTVGRDIWCWGANDDGQLGDGSLDGSLVPVPIEGLPDAAMVAVGDRHSCARSEVGTVWCWGSNDRGQLGAGAIAGSTRPVLTG